MQKTLLLVVGALVIIGGGWYLVTQRPPSVGTKGEPIAHVMYQCNGGKTIQADLYEASSTPSTHPDMPPQPGGSAQVTLSDGRSFDLSQTISADGARYSSGNPQVQGSETFVFWTKGNGAFVEEGAQQTQTYAGCIKVTSDPGGLPQVYESGSFGF